MSFGGEVVAMSFGGKVVFSSPETACDLTSAVSLLYVRGLHTAKYLPSSQQAYWCDIQVRLACPEYLEP